MRHTPHLAGSLLAVIAFVAAPSALGCGSGGGKNAGEPSADGGLGEQVYRLTGRVFDADDGHPLAAAELITPQKDVTRTDAEGRFSVASKKPAFELAVSSAAYAATTKPVGEAGYVELALKRIDRKQSFLATAGIVIELDSGTKLRIPANAMVNAAGKKPAGKLTAYVAEVDGRDRLAASALPGKSEGVDASGKRSFVSVARALSIDVEDEQGAPLQVLAGKTLTADFALASEDARPQTALSYDKDKRGWVAEGKAEVVLDGAKQVQRVAISHLSWHGYGDFFSKLTCVRVCVVDGKKQPVSSAQVWLLGASFPGVSSLFSGADGCAVGDVPTESEIVLVAAAEQGASAPRRATTAKTVHLASDDPQACAALEPLVIGAAEKSPCPLGFAACGKDCVDLGSDARHCSVCEQTCDGGQQCIAGECGACLWGQCAQAQAQATFSGWSLTSELPVARIHSVAAAPRNGFVYVLNGYTSSAACDYGTADGRIFYAAQKSDGSLGTWQENAAGTGGFARSIPGIAVSDGTLYVVGGAINGPNWDGAIWLAKPAADGSIAGFRSAPNAIADWVGSSPIVGAYKGVLYAGGGFNAFASPQTSSRFYHAALDPKTGEPGMWQATTDLPAGASQQGQLQFYDGYAYLVSGFGPEVYVSKVANNGDLGEWIQSPTKLPVTVSYPNAQVVGNRLFVVAGNGGAVYASTLSSGGTLAEWMLHSTVPSRVFIGYQGVATESAYYLIGDDDCSATAADAQKVYWGRFD